ncbi:MAG TPA: anhydro-N-acetylmuramic acid kinase [Gammaproteobacteria bacterium]|nr:anhydro-N-acetylmuramic acid kinase [Gammaproteobacteria bacterium]
MKQSSLYIGLMSGTSLDGIDAALVDFNGKDWRLIDTVYRSFPAGLREQLLALCNAASIDVDSLGHTDAMLARLYAETAQNLLQKNALSARDIAAIGCHGQTIRHRPPSQNQSDISRPLPYTLQIGDPNRIAELTGITTVADFRRRDIAAGGQGAPLVPAFHACALSSPTEYRVVLNIGGIANITLLSATGVSGFDTGPGNILLDMWTQRHFGQSCDRGGALAVNGRPDKSMLAHMLGDPYFLLAPPKSTGREYFNSEWLEDFLPTSHIDPLDVLNTLTHLTAHSIAMAIQRFSPEAERVLVCGGGVHNDFLMKLLAELLAPCRLGSTAEAGLDPDFVEATAFAWLASQTLAGKPGNLPGVTGANKAVILGGVYHA